MIACRSLLFRADRVTKLSNSCSAFKPLACLQGYGTYHVLNYEVKMASREDEHNVGDKSKKLKSINPVWKPLTTQTSSHEEYSSKDVKVELEAECQVQEVHNSTSTSISVSNAQNVTDVTEEVTERTVPFLSSSGLDDVGDGRALKGESVNSTEKHSIRVQVGASLIWFIIGKGGSTQKQIEEEMGVKIIIPSSKEEDSVVIEGFSIDSVAEASARIQAIIDEAVKSPSLNYSHFISLPLAIHPELVDKLVMFQNFILGSDPCLEKNVDSDSNEEYNEHEDVDQKLDKGPDVAVELKVDRDKERVKVNITNIPVVSYAPKTTASKSSTLSDMGIDKSIFIKPRTFHLTVLMLKLWNKERVDAATKVLQSISSKVMDALDNQPVSIRLRGLDCMRGSLAKAHVLYAPVEEIGSEGRLLCACQVIIDAFVKAGLVLEKDANRKLKLHATVMNTSHRKRTRWTRKRQFDSFDARSVFKQYGSEEWGEYVIREAHLSQRFVYDENGYYHCCASIPFPEKMQVD
ncbi:Activating signal cointegrator 1 complex subunit [Parasponia andersonii]|uniref:Activating signal cointegrator 1 complex subunit n=1 Tax=Parasponia andersonii TaxID=3476 RepID=A0A2P5BDN4_PARAD|nr:Activating signal cointegrator 1 complex subunit [Parasponia andersonii]